MKIGDKTSTGYIFDIQGECALEDITGITWHDATAKFSGTEWRLPTKEELNLMYKNLHKNGVGGFADNPYWSSSEYNNTNAWYQSFSSGNQVNSSKNNSSRVRAVRAFKIYDYKPEDKMKEPQMTKEQARQIYRLATKDSSDEKDFVDGLKGFGYIIQNPVEEIDYLIPKHYGEYTPEDITKMWNAIQYLKEEVASYNNRKNESMEER